MFPIRPISDVLIVKQCDHERVTPGGVVIPDVVEKPEQGEVVAAGPGRMINADEREPMRVKVGDRILFNKNLIQRVRIDGVEYGAVRQQHVMAVV